MDCGDGEVSQLPVDVTVEIPAFLYFQVGSANQTPEITFDATPTLPAQGVYNGSIPPVTSAVTPESIAGSDVNDGLNVTVRANCGDVKLSYAVSDTQGLSNGNGYHIPYDTLKTVSDDPGLPAPVLTNSADQEVLVGTTSYGAVTDRSTVWRYTYDNVEFPVSGIYQGTVTYQAGCL